jgi:hypothetical protein
MSHNKMKTLLMYVRANNTTRRYYKGIPPANYYKEIEVHEYVRMNAKIGNQHNPSLEQLHYVQSKTMPSKYYKKGSIVYRRSKNQSSSNYCNLSVNNGTRELLPHRILKDNCPKKLR